jgi:phosphoribosylaminoimidazole (AIR) synthetase
MGSHRTVGTDLVNHCVNDIAVQRHTPMFFWIIWRRETGSEIAVKVVEV